jgi:hypothetical protein
MASPVFADGKYISLPIPHRHLLRGHEDIYTITYDKLNLYGHNYGQLVSDLSSNNKQPILPNSLVHLDPDIVKDVYSERNPNWRPMFGQVGAAQGHLNKYEVAKGDLFLFFSLYRHVIKVGSKYTYDRTKPAFHMLWGWMQVDERMSLTDKTSYPEWMQDHPHFHMTETVNNTLFVGSQDLKIGNQLILKKEGAGSFGTYREDLQLTAPGSTKLTNWHVPAAWYNPNVVNMLTYHQKQELWNKLDNGKYELTAASIGQEFVLDCEENSELISWVKQLFNC